MRAPAGRAVRPRPVLRLPLPVLRLRRLRGPRGTRARQPGSEPSCGVPCGDRAASRRADARFGSPQTAGRALASVYLGGGTPSLAAGRGAIAALLELVRAALRARRGAEITLEANPGPDERGDLAGAARGRRDAPVAWARRASTMTSCAPWAGATAPADVATAVAEARRGGLRDVSLDLLYDVPGQTAAIWVATLEAALDARPRSRLALRPDARRSGRRGPHRARRATTCRLRTRGAGAGGRARGRVRTRTGPPTMDAAADEILAPAGLARLRDRQPCPAAATRAGTTSPTGSAPAVRGGGSGRARLRR